MTRQPVQTQGQPENENFSILTICGSCNALTRDARRRQVEKEGESLEEVPRGETDSEWEEQSEESDWPDSDKEEIMTKSMFKCSQDQEAWSDGKWLQEQNREEKEAANEYIKTIKEGLENGSEYHHKLFAEEEGFIIRKPKPTREKDPVRPAINRKVVPETLKAFIIGAHHNLEYAAHQGTRSTLRLVAHRYYWPDMKTDIQRWVRACSSCARRKTPRPTHAGRTEITQSHRPWQTVGIDLLGPLPKTKRNNVWILTIVDHFTRWPIAVPLENAESSTIAAALFDKVIAEHGVPDKILSDQGKNLISQGIKTLCERWGAAKVQTGGYNPQANGTCERFHRYLNAAITILQEEKNKVEWDEICSSVVFSYRVSTNDTTGHSPYFLVYGRDPKLPLDVVFSTKEEKYQNEDQYVTQMSERLRTAFDQARKLQYAAAKGNRDRNPKTREPEINVGEFCYVWAPGAGKTKTRNGSAIPKKWTFPWKGPYEVIQHRGRAGCALDVKGKLKSYPFNRLHKHIPWSDTVSTTAQWRLQNKPASGKDELKEEESTVKQIFKGDVVVFVMKMTKSNPRPWGLGYVLNADDQTDIEFQWLGNTRENVNGKFEPCWFQQSEKAYYYGSKLHTSHTPYTSWDTNTKIGVADVIITSRSHIILNANNAIVPHAKKVVEENFWVREERRKHAQRK
jgi:transposase InsO family protein